MPNTVSVNNNVKILFINNLREWGLAMTVPRTMND